MTVLQLMPHHPYPSYNIHHFDDSSTSYSPEAELHELVTERHHRGLSVVLEALLQGFIDVKSITTAAHRVLSGPIAPLLDRSPGDMFAAGPDQG